MSMIEIVIGIVNHTLPVIITLGIILIAVCLKVGFPYCQYVSLVSQADTDKGKEELARYLAKQAGGRKIDTNKSWRSFMPAARDLHKNHVKKKASQ